MTLDAETRVALAALSDGDLCALYEQWSQENRAAGHYSTDGASREWLLMTLADMALLLRERTRLEDYQRDTVARLRAALEAQP